MVALLEMVPELGDAVDASLAPGSLCFALVRGTTLEGGLACSSLADAGYGKTPVLAASRDKRGTICEGRLGAVSAAPIGSSAVLPETRPSSIRERLTGRPRSHSSSLPAPSLSALSAARPKQLMISMTKVRRSATPTWPSSGRTRPSVAANASGRGSEIATTGASR